MTEAQARKESITLVKFIAVFIVLAAGMIAAAFFSYRGYENHYKEGVKRELSNLADLKVAELERWRSERLGDAKIIHENAALSDLVARYFKNPLDRQAERRIRQWLKRYPEHYEYDQVRLLDAQGKTRLSFPPGRPPVSTAIRERMPKILRAGRITIIDFYRHEYDKQIYLSVIIPILDVSADNHTIGAVSLRLNPEKYFYPFIKRWLSSGRTAETLLVRREGNDVLFLSDLRFRTKELALKFRIPLERTDIPAVKAVLGQTGIVEGLNYLGAQVIADVRKVPDSPWFLVTRVYKAEVLEHAREHLLMITGLVTALVFGMGAALAFAWRQQNLVFYRERYRASEALRMERDNLLSFFRAMTDGVYIVDQSHDIKYVNHVLEKAFGPYTGRKCYEYFHERAGICPWCKNEDVFAGKTVRWEWHSGKNGRTYDLVDTPLFNPDGSIYKMEICRDITDRKRIEEELWSKQAMLSRTEEIAHLGSWELDLVNNSLAWSNEVYRIFGLKPQEFGATFEAFLNAVHPDDREAVGAAYSRSLRPGGGNYEIEHRIVRRSTGEVRYVHQKCDHFRDASGKVIRSSGMVQDITERKQAEEALRRSNSFNQSIIDSSSDCIKTLDMDGRLQYMSPAGQRLLGIKDIGEYLNVPYKEFWKGSVREVVIEVMRKAQQGEAGSFHGYCPTCDGTPKWWDVSISPVFGADGRPERLLAVSRDITERKRAEEELRRTSDRYRSYIDVTGQLGWTTNASGEIVEDPPSLRTYIGQTPAEIMGWGWAKALHPDDAEHTALIWRKAVSEKSPYETEYRLRRSDGVYRHFLARGIPVLSDDGSVSEWVGTCIDITERKQAEEALKKAHDELEQRVAQRTRFYNIRAQINKAAVSSRDVREYLDEVCRVMIETGGFTLAWIGIVDPESLAVNVAASSGATGYLEGVRISAADVPEGGGQTGVCIREGRHIINLDFETNDIMRPWLDRARRYGIRSSSAFPLCIHGEITGALMFYSSQPSFFAGAEVSLLIGIADDISFALEAFDTEQKRLQAEQELQKTAAELEDLYNNAPCGYHSLDKDGVIVRINDTELSWLGYSREEVVGKKKITDFYTPESVLTFKRGYPEFMENGTAEREINIVRRDGTIMHVSLSSTAIYDADGKYVMSRSMLYDVTDRRKSEKQSMVTNALLSLYARKFDKTTYLNAAVELIRDWSDCRHLGIRVVDNEKNIPYLSCTGFSEEFLATERTLSLMRDQCACTRVVLGKPEPQDLPAMTRAGSLYLNNTLRFVEGLTEEQKSRFRGVCVQNGFLSVAVVPIRYGDAIIGALHVADEREGMVPAEAVKFLEQLAFIIGEAVYRFGVEEERMRLAFALESTADGVVVTHAGNGRIEYVNRAFEQITGYIKDEAVGRTLHLLDSGRHDQTFFEKLRTTLRRDGVWRGQLISKKKDGTLYFEDCTFSPVRDNAGNILNYVSIKRDVTEKIRMESIAESVSMMDNIGAVFAGVRHEIGNPVNNVKMILSIIRQKLDVLAPDRLRYYVDRMLDETGRVEQLLKTLRTFNLFETPVVESLDSARLLSLFAGLVREDLEARGIELTIRILPGAERMHADARALQHVLLNLTTNAADALKDRDHPLISITLSREDDRVHIRIRDNGMGMTEQQQKNLFKPFQTTKPNGTGLGLVIVKKMLASIDGGISIDSAAGSGTLVHIHLPAENHLQLPSEAEYHETRDY